MTRGERNNNPGNIVRNDITWQGMAADQSTDARFVVFNDSHDGIRALAKILLNYQRRAGCHTPREIISRWAPASENDTAAYVAAVCNAVGALPDDPIMLGVSTKLAAFARAIIVHENGGCIYDDETISDAVSAALCV